MSKAWKIPLRIICLPLIILLPITIIPVLLVGGWDAVDRYGDLVCDSWLEWLYT